MRAGDLLAMSLGNYTRARLRSALTTAGVAIGTALVVLLIALATGAEDNVRRSIFSIGDLRLVTVQPFQPGANGLSAVPRTISDDTVAKLKGVAHVDGVYRQFDAPLGMVVEGGDDATSRHPRRLSESRWMTRSSPARRTAASRPSRFAKRPGTAAWRSRPTIRLTWRTS